MAHPGQVCLHMFDRRSSQPGQRGVVVVVAYVDVETQPGHGCCSSRIYLQIILYYDTVIERPH